jgi:hypothetical protein
MAAMSGMTISSAIRAALGVVLLIFFGMSSTACSMVPQWQSQQTILPEGGIRVPLWPGDTVPMVRVEGRTREEDYLVCIDTGSRDVELSPALAKRLNAQPHDVLPTISTDAAGVSVWQWKASWVRELTFESATFRGFDADVLDLSPSFRTRIPVLAILGLNLFHDCLMTIDFPSRQLVLERGELPPENGRDILHYRWHQMGNLEIQATLGGRSLWVKVDTGSNNIILSDDIASTLKFIRPPQVAGTLVGIHGKVVPESSGAVNGNLVFGSYSFPNPSVRIGGRQHRVLIGADLLSAFLVTIDQKHQRIRFRRPETSVSGV